MAMGINPAGRFGTAVGQQEKIWLSLQRRLFKIYAGVSLLGIMIITCHNLYINRYTLTEFIHLVFFIKLLLGCLLIVSFQVVSIWRLGPVRTYLREQDPDKLLAAWKSLVRFPAELFWGMVIYGLIVSPAYHLVAIAQGGGQLLQLSKVQRLYLMENLMFDQALTLMLAALFYAILRRVSRSYLSVIRHYSIQGIRTSSIAHPLLTTFLSVLLISNFSMLWLVTNAVSSGREIHLSLLFTIAGATFILAVVLFMMQVIEHRNNFREMIASIRALLDREGQELRGNMPIVSTDEAGMLASVFNELQGRISKEYEEVERELELAYNVQQKILPKPCEDIGFLRIAGAYRPTKEVSGDFYDVIKLNDDRVAVAIGDVSGKGMQAALIMSAVVVMLRMEVRSGGAASDVLQRINRSLVEIVQEYSYVTMGLGIIDLTTSSMEYAGAGHVSPYLIRAGEARWMESPALPLGIDPDTAYRSVQREIQEGDRIVFYTDGVIEAMDEQNEMYGFDLFAAALLQLDTSISPAEAVQKLMDELPQGTRLPYNDDRTLLLIQVERKL